MIEMGNGKKNLKGKFELKNIIYEAGTAREEDHKEPGCSQRHEVDTYYLNYLTEHPGETEKSWTNLNRVTVA